MFSLFRKTPAQTFWAWFEKNEALLFDFERRRDAAFAALGQALEKFEQHLEFEFGPKGDDGRRELVISAGGIKAKFPPVQALVAAAPRLARWRITAFRPRRNPIMTLQLGDIALRPQDIDVCLLTHGRELGLNLFFRGHTEHNHAALGQAGFLMLDEAIGEHDVSMKVGPIEFLSFDKHPDADRFPLTELATRFDAHYARLLQ